MRKHRANSDNITRYDKSELMAFIIWGAYCAGKWPDGHPHTKEKARRMKQKK